MPIILDEIAVQLSLDATRYGAGAGQAAQQSRQLDAAMKEAAASANAVQAATDKAAQQAQVLRESYARYQRELRSATQSTQQLTTAQRAAANPAYARSVEFVRDRLNEMRAASTRAAGETRRLADSQRTAASASRTVATHVGGLVSQIALLGAGVTTAVVGIQYFFNSLRQGVENLKTVGRFIFNTNREFQALDAQLKTALGSAEAARAAFRLIQDFAQDTPFRIASLTTAFADLSQFGFVPLKDELTGLGNIAAARGQDITKLSAAIVSAVNTTVEPIRQFGVQAKISGDQMIVTFDGVTQTIDRSIPALAEFLAQQGQIGDRSAAMANQVDTLNGSINQAANAAHEFALQAGDAGLNKELVKTIRSVTEMIKESDELAVKVGSVAAGAIEVFRGALERVQPVLAGVADLMAFMSKVDPFTRLAGSRISGFLADAREAAALNRQIRESTEPIRGFTDLTQARGLQGDLAAQIGRLSNPFATSGADRQRLPFLKAQMEAATEQVALLQARADAAATGFQGFGNSTKAAADEVERIQKALAEGRREIAAMEAATAGTSIEFDAAKESAQLLERAIRDLAGTGREDALAVIPALVEEWKRYEAEVQAAADATKRAKEAQEQLAAAERTAAEFRQRHQEAVAEFRNRQFEISRELAQQELEFQRSVAEGIATAFTDNLNAVIQKVKDVGEAFRNMASQVIADIQRILIQRSVIEPIVNALFPAAGTAFLDSLKGGAGRIDLGGPGGGLPHFATGGPIQRGQPAIVGEEGPELFVPASAGRIEPGSFVAAGSRTELVEIHAPMTFSFPGVNATEAVQLARQMTPELSVTIVREIERRFALRKKLNRP